VQVTSSCTYALCKFTHSLKHIKLTATLNKLAHIESVVNRQVLAELPIGKWLSLPR
jgi:hypothetical protein